MLRIIAKVWAKVRYRFNQEAEAASNEINAKLAARNAQEKRELAARFIREAEAMESRIKELDEKLDKGFWECENGHEHEDVVPGTDNDCVECREKAKFVRRDQMTGQEKYESDKERGEAEKMAQQKRDQAKAQEDSAGESDKAAKYFRDIAQSNRSVAEKVRRL